MQDGFVPIHHRSLRRLTRLREKPTNIMKLYTAKLLFLSFFLFTACQPAEEPADSADEMITVNDRTEPSVPIVRSMLDAHAVSAFRQKEAIAMDIILFWGGQKRMEARLTTLTNSGKIRMDRADGASLIYDGEQVYLSPDTAQWPRARFDIFTWHYFMMAPFKFNDPGTNWEDMGTMPLDSVRTELPAAKLTFSSGTGDAPDDWYITYQDTQSELLKGMAYIVTYSATQEEAEEEPHAIEYVDYQSIDGIPVAREWHFRMWSAEEGMGEQIGRAVISNVSFVPDPDFTVPQGAKVVPAPKRS
jgi:outer membrane lipoprotein-sorting protein